LLGRFASTVAAVRPTAIATAIALIFTAGGIESSEIFPNRMRCFLTLRPGNRLVAGEPLLLVHICCDQARIDRERFAANKPSRDARRHHALEHPAQDIALTKARMPRTAEHRMIGNPVLDTELAKPSVGQIDLHLSANPSFRADRKHVADDQHSDHENRINRGPARV
jgi:hypothetical protein